MGRTRRLRSPAALCAAAVFALIPAGVGHAAPVCETSWTGGNGFWDDATKWSNGVPDATQPARDQACIIAGGTYTVTIRNDVAWAQELTLGSGVSGLQTLKLEANPAWLRLFDQGGGAAEGIRSTGRLMLSSVTGQSSLTVQGGPLVNDGRIVATAGGHPNRFIEGSLVNNGRFRAASERTTQTSGGAQWVNNGTIEVLAGALLQVGPDFSGSDTDFTQGPAGSIENEGTFRHVRGTLHFDGTATGNPIEVFALTGASGGLWAPAGNGTIRILGTSPLHTELESDVGPNVVLAPYGLEGQPGGDAALVVPASRTNRGTIRLSSTARKGATLYVFDGATLLNRGTVRVVPGGARNLWGDIDNRGTIDIETTTNSNSGDWSSLKIVDLAAGATLSGLATFTHPTLTRGQRVHVGIDSATSFAQFSGGAYALGPTSFLQINRPAAYEPPNGTSFPIITGSSRSGTFYKVTNAVITGSRYFRPVYTATGVELVVTTAGVAVNPTSAPQGASVTVSGSGFPANKRIQLRLDDATPGSESIVLGHAQVNASGSFSKSEVIPAAAVDGPGTVLAISGMVNVTAQIPFTVS